MHKANVVLSECNVTYHCFSDAMWGMFLSRGGVSSSRGAIRSSALGVSDWVWRLGF